MVVDLKHPEKGVYMEEFDIPTECSCAMGKANIYKYTKKPVETKGINK